MKVSIHRLLLMSGRTSCQRQLSSVASSIINWRNGTTAPRPSTEIYRKKPLIHCVQTIAVVEIVLKTDRCITGAIAISTQIRAPTDPAALTPPVFCASFVSGSSSPPPSRSRRHHGRLDWDDRIQLHPDCLLTRCHSWCIDPQIQ